MSASYDKWEASLKEEPKLYCIGSKSDDDTERRYTWIWNESTAIVVAVKHNRTLVGWNELIGRTKMSGLMEMDEAVERIDEYFEKFGFPQPPMPE